MRSDNDIINTILSVAKNNENIRLVCMNGSRVNNKVDYDQYQDFDISYIVNDLKELTHYLSWINKFGNIIMMQLPDNQDLYENQSVESFHILMLFDDYKRIDLTLITKKYLSEYLSSDSLLKILLDKDNVVDNNFSPDDSKYWLKEPYQKLFDECINEFYWVSTYVMKGLWRNQLLYAFDHLNICREMLLLMLAWDKGHLLDYKVNFGKNYKYLTNHMSKSEENNLISTYPTLNSSEIKKSLYKMIIFFDDITKSVSDKCDLIYDGKQYLEVKKYIGFDYIN
ncbi:TPA: aminoglycoside 6-adenylyltransferase [Staphylococcus aureus]|uniref:aminoglycoside 6-adenylyltransferase n=1 Tax=Staphylococcus aureus TaxID=1280 RepID=UPI00112F3CBC|nr:aminoglycoside 6-adenylyltransferase [Staphylococcus aureus]